MTNKEPQDREYLEKILNYLRIHKPEKANEKETERYLTLMKGFAEELVDKDLEFAELLLKAIEEAKSQPEENEQSE